MTRPRRSFIGFLFCFSSLCWTQTPPVTAVRSARMLDVKAGAYVPSAAVLIQNGRIVDAGSGLALDDTNFSTRNGNLIQQFQPTGNSNQQWTYTSDSELRVLGSKCLDAAGTGNGVKVQIYSCWGGDNQKWRINSDGCIGVPARLR